MPKSREQDSKPQVGDSEFKPSPISLALEWVARITAVSLVMVLPGIFGHWVDGKAGTSFFTLSGFAIGFVAGFVALLAMVKPRQKQRD